MIRAEVDNYHVLQRRLHLFSRIDHQHDPDYRQYEQQKRRDVEAESHAGEQGQETAGALGCFLRKSARAANAG